ncbi:hypothetical protein J8873_23280 [Phocaeicola dorei]|uniref:hypothetical protein n=1 Tax=Phocaeicola dorei TaxID=357276 RepID=UPI001F261D13|nr:hypothetical protein [Phocaeicola dorei]MCE8447141.1 hypothetical protein [Phocaeicola dorei]
MGEQPRASVPFIGKQRAYPPDASCGQLFRPGGAVEQFFACGVLSCRESEAFGQEQVAACRGNDKVCAVLHGIPAFCLEYFLVVELRQGPEHIVEAFRRGAVVADEGQQQSQCRVHAASRLYHADIALASALYVAERLEYTEPCGVAGGKSLRIPCKETRSALSVQGIVQQLADGTGRLHGGIGIAVSRRAPPAEHVAVEPPYPFVEPVAHGGFHSGAVRGADAPDEPFT